MKKSVKAAILITLVIAVIIVFFITDGIFGNPVSGLTVRIRAERYINTNYPGTVYGISAAVYNFKDGSYSVKASPEGGGDGYFTVYADRYGNILSDTYDDIAGGRNTYDRINREYMTLTESVFALPEFNVGTSYAYGTLAIKEEAEFGLDVTELIPDKTYDLPLLAADCGYLRVFAHDAEVSYGRAAEILLLIRELFDREKIPFYMTDFALYRPFTDSEAKSDENHIDIYALPYSEITSDGLEESLREAAEKHAADNAGKKD